MKLAKGKLQNVDRFNRKVPGLLRVLHFALFNLQFAFRVEAKRGWVP
jgi:hypothetical protein